MFFSRRNFLVSVVDVVLLATGLFEAVLLVCRNDEDNL